MHNDKIIQKEAGMENKEEIVKRLKMLLVVTRIGDNIEDLVLSENQDMVRIQFKQGGHSDVDIAGDSGYAIIKDVLGRL